MKEEKQHIENQLAKNDLKIKQYCEEYEELRHSTDYEQLTKNETIVLKSIISGLEEASVNPTDVLGTQIEKHIENKENVGNKLVYELSAEEVVQIQESIIRNLWE